MATSPMLGQITVVGFNFPPRGWALCDGQLLAISQNSALFSLLGTIYGGDGRTTFALPDMRGRAVMHWGTGPGLSSINIGQRLNKERHTLTTTEIPPHNHTYQVPVSTQGITTDEVNGNYLTTRANPSYAATPTPNQYYGNGEQTNPTGSSVNFSILQPYIVVYMCIALQGTYPSRT